MKLDRQCGGLPRLGRRRIRHQRSNLTCAQGLLEALIVIEAARNPRLGNEGKSCAETRSGANVRRSFADRLSGTTQRDFADVVSAFDHRDGIEERQRFLRAQHVVPE